MELSPLFRYTCGGHIATVACAVSSLLWNRTQYFFHCLCNIVVTTYMLWAICNFVICLYCMNLQFYMRVKPAADLKFSSKFGQRKFSGGAVCHSFSGQLYILMNHWNPPNFNDFNGRIFNIIYLKALFFVCYVMFKINHNDQVYH